MSGTVVLGIMGGSGVYDLDCLENREYKVVQTPFGAPSDELLIGTVNGTKLVFLSRHGRGHRHSPTSVPYQANVFAMKMEGVTDMLSLSAVGSLKEELPPGHFVVVDQFIDRTFQRAKSFFGDGLVAHTSCAEPICSRLAQHLESTARELNYRCHRGGTYLCMEGPQFSSKAESELYRSWGCSVIGMTNMPEAKLAREAEICYSTLAMVTDYDCWHEGHDAVEVTSLLAVLRDNSARAKKLVEAAVLALTERPDECPHGCDRALESALITAPDSRCPELVEKLQPLLRRFEA